MYKYIILIIIILIIININKKEIIKENFTTDEEQKIKTYINDIYKADIEATRNLSNYASYLMGTSSITAPGTIKSTSNLCVNDKCLDQNDISKLLDYTKNNKLNDQVNFGNNNNIMFDLQNTQQGSINIGGTWGSADLKTITFKTPFKVLTPTIYLAVDYIKLCDNDNIQGLQLWSKNVSKTGFTAYTWVPDYWSKACKTLRIKWLAVAVSNTDSSDNGQV